MHDIQNFTPKDMAECSMALRQIGSSAESMEDAADRIVRYLYEQISDQETGKGAFVLARFFKTHPYGELDDVLRHFALGALNNSPVSPSMKCLTLLATAGLSPEWNSRRLSKGHKAIPLPSVHSVEQYPLIRHLVQQLGLEVNSVLQPDPEGIIDLAKRTYDVFFVSEAKEIKYVPAQREFVIPYGVRSALSFGGILPSGSLFAVILFSTSLLGQETVDMFRTLALSVKLAVLPFDNGKVFSDNGRDNAAS